MRGQPGSRRTILPDCEVARIREHYAEQRYTVRQLAELWGCTTENIRLIVSGRSRKSAPGPITPVRGDFSPATKVTAETVIRVRELYATDRYTQGQLAEKFGIGQSNINYIVTGRTWAHVGGPVVNRGRGPWRRLTGAES